MKDIQLIKIETAPIDPRISGAVVDCLSLSILGAVLKEKGFKTDIYINQYEEKKNTKLLERIAKKNPKVIGLTTKIFNVVAVEEATKYITKYFPDKKIILGGTQYDQYFSKLFMEKNPHIHAIIRGHGEITLPLTLESILNGLNLKGIQGVTHKQGNEIIIEPNRSSLTDEELESLPTPIFDLVEDISVEERSNKTAQLRTSTGCNGSCAFCYNQEGKWRKQSAEKTLAQMEEYVKKGFRRFLIVDNNFVGTDINRVIKFAEGVLDLRKKYNTPLYFQFDARSDSFGTYKEGFRHDVLELLFSAGLYDIFTGIEAGNPYDLERYGKCKRGQEMLEQNKFYLTEMRKYHKTTTVTPGFINFNSDSKIERIRENLKFIYEYLPPQFAPEIYWYNMSYYVGSKLTRDSLKKLEEKKRNKDIEKIMYGNFTPQIKDATVREFYEELYSLKPRLRDAYRVIATMLQDSKLDLEKDVQSLHELNYKYISQLLNLVEKKATKKEKETLKQEYEKTYLGHLKPYISTIANLTKIKDGDEYNSVLKKISFKEKERIV